MVNRFKQTSALLLCLLSSRVFAGEPEVTLTMKPVRDAGSEVTGIEVRTRLTAGPADLHLTAPVVYAGVRGIADRITQLDVRDQQGTIALSVSDDPAAPGGFPYFRHWKSQRPVQYPVTVSYHSLVQPVGSNNGPPFGIRPAGGGVSGAGSGFLLLPADPAPRLHVFKWDLSELAAGSSGITSLGEGSVEVRAPSADLLHVWFMAGPTGRYPASGHANGFSAAWLGNSPFDANREMHWAADVYAYLTKAFGYLDPAPRYRVFMRFLDTPPFGGGTALSNSFMLSQSSAPKPGQESDRRGTLFHEMIHQWVGEIEGPVGVTSWFSEGLTTYYTALLPLRGGFNSVDEFAAEINRIADGYWGSVARNWSAEKIAAAGFGDERTRHVPYNRGALYFADLDVRIREKSQGKRRLDDFLLPMFKSRHRGTRFGQDAWLRMVTQELGPSAADEFRRVILDGKMLVPAAGAFGPCFERRPKSYEVDGAVVSGYEWVRVPSVPEKKCRMG